jgi:hypothetical protein
MLRKFVMNNTFLRSGKLIFGEFGNYHNKPGDFIPYFQYEIGPYQDDFKLYFSKMPFAIRYYNSIFLKLWNYNAHDATRYLEAHFIEYPDKERFLQFLSEQLKFRIGKFKKGSRSNLSLISSICLEWVQEKMIKWKDAQKIDVYNQFIRQDLNLIVKTELQNNVTAADSHVSVEHLTNQICRDLESKMASILETTESRIIDLADKYETGDIQIVNLSMKDKLITLLLCLKYLNAKPSRKSKPGDPLFSKMDLNDIAQILKLHFAPYKGLKIDSIEKRIYEVNNNLKLDDPTYQDLFRALQKFFFN